MTRSTSGRWCPISHDRPMISSPPCQVNVKRGQTYSRCVGEQSSTASAPCEAGVEASDAVDGPSIQNRVSRRKRDSNR